MALRKENILIVDDDIDILELLQRHLKSMDYHTYKAVSVKEALYILKDTYIDLLITDIQMPELERKIIEMLLLCCQFINTLKSLSRKAEGLDPMKP